MKTYRGLRRRGEQRHGAGVLRPLLRSLSVRGHGRFAERDCTDYKQRQTNLPAKKGGRQQSATGEAAPPRRAWHHGTTHATPPIFLFKKKHVTQLQILLCKRTQDRRRQTALCVLHYWLTRLKSLLRFRSTVDATRRREHRGLTIDATDP